MGLYRVRVSTGSSLCAGSNNQVHLWLVGEHGEAALGGRLRPWPLDQNRERSKCEQMLGSSGLQALQEPG